MKTLPRNLLWTRILAVSGTVLCWIPLLAPLFFSILHLARSGMFLFDYLMPAELFPVVLLGGGLLLWASLRLHTFTRLIAWCLGGAVVLLVGGQILAMVTGLATGEIEATGFWWVVVMATIIIYIVGVAGLALTGILLLREAFKKPTG